MRFWLRSAVMTLASAAVMLLLVCLISPQAQSFVIGYFTRIYMGSTTGPQIRWGSADPTLPCTPGSLYLQKSSTELGDIWKCTPLDPGTTDVSWTRIANQIRIGDDFYATQFGAVCDAATDDTVALQNTIDAAYAYAAKAGRVILPAGTCNTSGIQFGPVTDPWQTSASSPLDQPNLQIRLTSGDQTHVEILSGGTVDPAHVGKSFTFAAPLIKSTIDFAGNALIQPAPANWFKYFSATVVSVQDPTHFTMSIVGLDLTGGSLRVNQFPDLPHANQCVNLPTGNPGTGCIASYWCHEHAHLEANCGTAGTSATIDNLIDYTALEAGTFGHLYPYSLPADTSQRFLSLQGSSEAVTSLRWIGNTTALPVLTFSKNKYFTAENVGVFNAAGSSPAASAALAGAGSGNVDNGVHSYRVACQYGLSTIRWGSAGPVTVVDKTINGQVTVSTPVCGNNNAGDAATARVVYRTKAGMGTYGPWYVLTTLANNSATTYTDNTADASLTTQGFEYGNTIGIYLGGLPGAGTQTLVSTLRNMQAGNEGTGFRYGVLLGDNLGGETSEIRFERLSVVGNDVGIATAAGGFNVLDIFLDQLIGGFNKVAVESNTGNLMATNGSFSFNGVDFYSKGFGPLSIRGFRSEGPGRFFYGGEPGVHIEEVSIAEPQGARAITGNVTATPDNIRSVDVNVTSTTCPNNICPITFTSGDIVGTDPRKILVLPGIGTSGRDVIAVVNSMTSATAGTIWVQGSTPVATTGVVTATLYDTNTCDLTWPSGQVGPNDVGGAFLMPEATIANNWSHNIQVYLTEYLTATTGKGFFYLGNDGAGPVAIAGGTTANPTFFDRTSIEITNGSYQYTVANHLGSGRIFVNPSGNGGLRVTDSTVLAAAVTLTDQLTLPVWVRVPGVHYVINPYTAVPTSSITTGIPFAVTADSNTDPKGSDFDLLLSNLRSAFFAGPVFSLPDVHARTRAYVTRRITTSPKASAGTATGNFYYQNYPFDPVGITQQIGSLKELNEGAAVNGRNLRQLCTFATSDTATCTFQRSEAYTFNSNGTGGTTSDAATSSFRILVTSGNFSQMDVGKIIKFPACCGDFAAFANGPVDLWATITGIFDATHVDVRVAQGAASGFPNGTTMGTATVGQDEPDANWRPALWGCTGLDTGANEVITITSWTASQVVLTSSSATSTASCLVGVIR